MSRKNFLTAFLMPLSLASGAQNLEVQGTYAAGNVEELELVMTPTDGGVTTALARVQSDNTTFAAVVEPSSTGFYTLYGKSGGGQLILPLYFPDTAQVAKINLSLNKNCPMADSDNDNKALSAYNAFMYEHGKYFWMNGHKMEKEDLRPFLQSYMNVADSIAEVYQCASPVAEYLKLWAYTTVWKTFPSIPQATKHHPDSLSFTLSDLLDDPKQTLNSPLAVCFPEVSYIVGGTLPKGTIKERLTYLHATYQDEAVRKKVTAQLVETYIKRFDYSSDFEGGLATLKEVVETYGLDQTYIQEFVKRRASAKGTPFPAGITMVDVEGQPVDFSAFKGYYVYIDLWASWCGPCCREVPYLQALEKELKNPNVKFVSISIDKNEKAWKAKMQALDMHGNQLLNQDNSLATALNVRGIPYFMIYDKEGKLYMSNAPRPSHPQLKNLLEELK